MIKFFKLFFICFYFYSLGNAYAVILDKQDFYKMSCHDLMNGLMRESSYKFRDKNLELYYERYNDKYIGITNACSKDCIYENFKLDLVKQTLKFTDPSPPVLININENYIPFIAKKCTSNENLYRRGKLPETDIDGEI